MTNLRQIESARTAPPVMVRTHPSLAAFQQPLLLQSNDKRSQLSQRWLDAGTATVL